MKLTSSGICLALSTILMPGSTDAQKSAYTMPTSGTLNLVLANKNGFVIAADSRRSGESRFPCREQLQLHCDDSQKLFRTSPNSALAIAGFAVGEAHTPLDLAVASVLRKRFGLNGLPNDNNAGGFANLVRADIEDPLTDVAALWGAQIRPEELGLTVTLARLNESRVPILKQLVFKASVRPAGPLQVSVPAYTDEASNEVTVNKFLAVMVGITSVADAILNGRYQTTDPVIQTYYRIVKSGQRDAMRLSMMRALAVTILRETRKFTELVGGEDQIGIFPVTGNASFHLPTNLPTEAQLLPNIMRWEALDCSPRTPPCGEYTSVSFRVDPRTWSQPYLKYFNASQFTGIDIVLGRNVFVDDKFDSVTFKWTGGDFYFIRSAFINCTLELPSSVALPPSDELPPCQIVRKEQVEIAPDTIGSTPMTSNLCAKWDSAGNCVRSSGFYVAPPQP